jgi:DNA-binding GntR family transcriptional regulator
MADAMFHGRLIELSGNATLHRVWRQLEPVSRTYITLVVPGADRHRIADLHQPVLDALRHRDAARATDALDRHYLVLGAMLAELWTVAPSTPASLQTERTP